MYIIYINLSLHLWLISPKNSENGSRPLKTQSRGFRVTYKMLRVFRFPCNGVTQIHQLRILQQLWGKTYMTPKHSLASSTSTIPQNTHVAEHYTYMMASVRVMLCTNLLIAKPLALPLRDCDSAQASPSTKYLADMSDSEVVETLESMKYY